MEKRTHVLNTIAGVAAIINAVISLMAPYMLLGSLAGDLLDGLETGDINPSETRAVTTFLMIAGLISLGLHIAGCVVSKQKNISITGHILGIIAAALLAFVPLMGIVSMVLFILAAVFCIKQKNTDGSLVMHGTTNNSSVADELKKYKELFESGAISEEEYNEVKKRLIG